MRTITREEALHALNEAVAMKGPDYVDAFAAKGETCRNVVKVGGTWVPSCIVGTALVWLGVPAEWFAMECQSVSIGTAAQRLRRDGVMNLTDDAVELMAQAQTKQDQKNSWGDAVAYAALGFDTFHSLEPRLDEPEA